MQIKDLLTINLDEEINTVVDLDENPSEAEIKDGLDSFVLTNSLGKHLADFLEEYNNGTMESGVWLSGFYGSGKSYFAQIIGLLLENPSILGTKMRDRFDIKLDGLANKDLLKNEINSLSRLNNIVVTFDASKHNNVKGLPFMIFSSLLRKLGMPGSWQGVVEFDLYLEGRHEDFLNAIQEVAGQPWSEVQKSNSLLSKKFEPALKAIGFSDDEIKELKELAKATRDEYDAHRLQQDLRRFLEQTPDTRIVFFIDEVSEAITQRKIRLDDLEGVAEALAALGRKVWTIAIAQQRLDDVIKAENIQINSLTKVRDRFRTKVAIEADEVDTIIRHRLLAKTDANRNALRDYFAEHDGIIADVSNLGVPSLDKTTNAETYVDYYPFFKHQFKLLQYFLFGTSELTQTRVGNRGMIISAFDVLKREVKHQTSDHYHVNATQLCNQADNRVEESLLNRYRQAEEILRDQNFDYISGKKLLQTIHFLTSSGTVHTTADHIAKSYLNKPEDYHDILAEIKRALAILEHHQVIISAGEQYRITNEAEQRILDDMNRFDVQSFEIIQDINKALRPRDVVKWAASINIGGMNVKYKVATADGEVFENSNENNLSVIFSDIYTSQGSENAAYVDSVRTETADSKGVITIIPDIRRREEIKALIVEIRRLEYIKDRANLTDEERKIVNSLCIDLPAKIDRRNELVEEAYLNGVLVYCFNKFILNRDQFRSTLNQEQTKMFENIFTKRLSAELSDSLAAGVFNKQDSQLHNYFGNSPEFKFFDTSGTFIGTSLSVVTEILSAITTFTSGRDLETKLAGPPTGYNLGTIMSTLAALFRGNKIIVKYNGQEYTSFRQQDATEPFKNSRNFARASFKAVSQSLSYNQRRDIVDTLKENCGYNNIFRSNPINYQLNDFEVVDAIRSISRAMIAKINDRLEYDDDYRTMFASAIAVRPIFQEYQAPVTEANFLRTAQKFLIDSNTEEFIKAVERVNKAIKFIDSNMADIRKMVSYIEDVKDQFDRATGNIDAIKAKYDHFYAHYNNDIVSGYTHMKQDVQEIRDAYIVKFKDVAAKVKAKYTDLLAKAEEVKTKIAEYPAEWNSRITRELSNIISRCQTYADVTTTFDNYSVKSLGSRLDLREISTALENVDNLGNQIYSLSFQIRTTDPNPQPQPQPKPATDGGTPQPPTPQPPTPPAPVTHKLKSRLPQGNISITEYRSWLTSQLHLLNSLNPNDLINLND